MGAAGVCEMKGVPSPNPLHAKKGDRCTPGAPSDSPLSCGDGLVCVPQGIYNGMESDIAYCELKGQESAVGALLTEGQKCGISGTASPPSKCAAGLECSAAGPNAMPGAPLFCTKAGLRTEGQICGYTGTENPIQHKCAPGLVCMQNDWLKLDGVPMVCVNLEESAVGGKTACGQCSGNAYCNIDNECVPYRTEGQECGFSRSGDDGKCATGLVCTTKEIDHGTWVGVESTCTKPVETACGGQCSGNTYCNIDNKCIPYRAEV